jgi:hypothetical protein
MTASKKEPSSPDTLVKASEDAAVALTEEELTKVAGGGDGSVSVAAKAKTKVQPTESVSLNFSKVQFD